MRVSVDGDMSGQGGQVARELEPGTTACPPHPSAPVLEEDVVSTTDLDLTTCPNCGRQDTLVVLTDYAACAACGYSSEGLRGCT